MKFLKKINLRKAAAIALIALTMLTLVCGIPFMGELMLTGSLVTAVATLGAVSIILAAMILCAGLTGAAIFLCIKICDTLVDR